MIKIIKLFNKIIPYSVYKLMDRNEHKRKLEPMINFCHTIFFLPEQWEVMGSECHSPQFSADGLKEY